METPKFSIVSRRVDQQEGLHQQRQMNFRAGGNGWT
jgi:hypothetical protein